MATKPKRYNPQTKFTDSTTNFSGGINQALSASRLRENEFLELINLDIDKVGQAVKRYGLKQFAINQTPLHTIIINHLLETKQATPENIARMEVYNGFHFYDGARNTLHFETNIGLISVIFNREFTDIETSKPRDATVPTKLITLYPNIIENIRYINYNSQHLLYVSRPQAMSRSDTAPVSRDEINDTSDNKSEYGDRDNFKPLSQDNFITVDSAEPNTVYVWNPTNKNKIKLTDFDKDNNIQDINAVKEMFLTIQPIGWVQNFNFNAPNKNCPDYEGEGVKALSISSSLANINEIQRNGTCHSQRPFDENDASFEIDISSKTYFIDPNGSFEYVKRAPNKVNHMFVYKSAYGRCEIQISELSTLGENDFLNFPIIFYEGKFYFGGCSEHSMYFYEVSLDELRNNTKITNPTLRRKINAENQTYKRGEKFDGLAAPSNMNIRVFKLFDDAVFLESMYLKKGTFKHPWYMRFNPAGYTSFELIKNYNPWGNCYGKVVSPTHETYILDKIHRNKNKVIEIIPPGGGVGGPSGGSWERRKKPYLALPVYHTISTAGGLETDYYQWKAVIPTDVLYDVTINTHNLAVGLSDLPHFGGSGDEEQLLKHHMDKNINEINTIKYFYMFYEENEYFNELCEDFSTTVSASKLYREQHRNGFEVSSYAYEGYINVFRKKTPIIPYNYNNYVSTIRDDDKLKVTSIHDLFGRHYRGVKSYFGGDRGRFGIKGITNNSRADSSDYVEKELFECFVMWAYHGGLRCSSGFAIRDDVNNDPLQTQNQLGFNLVYRSSYRQAWQDNIANALSFPDVFIDYQNKLHYRDINNLSNNIWNYQPVSVIDNYAINPPSVWEWYLENNNNRLRRRTGFTIPMKQALANDLQYRHDSDLPNINYNQLSNDTIKKLNYIGHGFLKEITTLNRTFNRKIIWTPFDGSNKVNNTTASSLEQFVNNDIQFRTRVGNNLQLTYTTSPWTIEFAIREDLRQRIKDGNLTGVNESDAGTIADEWMDNFFKPYFTHGVGITLHNAPSTYGSTRIEAINIGNFECFYRTYSSELSINNFNQDKVNDFISSLPSLYYLFFYVNDGKNDIATLSINREVAEKFLENFKTKTTRPFLRFAKYGTSNVVQGLRVDWLLNIADDYITIFDDAYITNNNIALSLQNFNRHNIRISGIEGVKVSPNQLTFSPIREYIPTVNDIKTNSYNLINLDGRNVASQWRKPDMKQWDTNISRWLVRTIPPGGVDTKPQDFYLGGILPTTTLTLNPLEDIAFKLYAFVPYNRDDIVVRWINCSVDEYNQTFFNNDYDWRAWFKEGTYYDRDEWSNANTNEHLWGKIANIPYGDREWIIGWAVIRVDDSFTKDDVGKLGEEETKKKIKSAAPLLSTLNFIPNQFSKEGLLSKSFYEFINTNKATTFAGRVVLYGNCNKLFFSDINNPTYFPLFNTIELPNQEQILSCVEFGYYLIVSTENFKYILRGRSFDNNSESPFTLDNISTDTGSISVDADKTNGNYLFFLDKTGIKALVNAYGTAEKEYKFKPVDELINPLLPDLVGKQGAIATTHDNRYYIHFPNTKQMFVYYNELQTWTQYESELMNFSKLYSDNGYLYCVGRNSMDLYWFDKDTYVDGYTGLDGAWDENQYGVIWADSIGSMDGTYQKGIPIQTSLITRPIGGLDEDSIKAFYDIVINVRTNAPMNNLDLRIKLDDAPVIDTWSMSDGITNQHGMLFTHFLSTSKQQIDYYTRLFPQAVLNQTAVANYSRLGYTDLNTHKVKGLGRKGRELIIGIRNKTPASYAIESINVDYKFRSSK